MYLTSPARLFLHSGQSFPPHELCFYDMLCFGVRPQTAPAPAPGLLVLHSGLVRCDHGGRGRAGSVVGRAVLGWSVLLCKANRSAASLRTDPLGPARHVSDQLASHTPATLSLPTRWGVPTSSQPMGICRAPLQVPFVCGGRRRHDMGCESQLAGPVGRGLGHSCARWRRMNESLLVAAPCSSPRDLM